LDEFLANAALADADFTTGQSSSSIELGGLSRADGGREGKEPNHIFWSRGYCCQEPFLIVESGGTGGEKEADGTEGWIDYS
jgi:hypothetical protein